MDVTAFDSASMMRSHNALVVRLRRMAGIVLTLNFAIFWALTPLIVGGGFAYVCWLPVFRAPPEITAERGTSEDGLGAANPTAER